MAAREAGGLLLTRLGDIRDVRLKSPGNPVTDVDLIDELPDGSWTYQAGSAVITYPDLSQVQLDPAIASNTLTWDISQTPCPMAATLSMDSACWPSWGPVPGCCGPLFD